MEDNEKSNVLEPYIYIVKYHRIIENDLNNRCYTQAILVRGVVETIPSAETSRVSPCIKVINWRLFTRRFSSASFSSRGGSRKY